MLSSPRMNHNSSPTTPLNQVLFSVSRGNASSRSKIIGIGLKRLFVPVPVRSPRKLPYSSTC